MSYLGYTAVLYKFCWYWRTCNGSSAHFCSDACFWLSRSSHPLNLPLNLHQNFLVLHLKPSVIHELHIRRFGGEYTAACNSQYFHLSWSLDMVVCL